MIYDRWTPGEVLHVNLTYPDQARIELSLSLLLEGIEGHFQIGIWNDCAIYSYKNNDRIGRI